MDDWFLLAMRVTNAITMGETIRSSLSSSCLMLAMGTQQKSCLCWNWIPYLSVLDQWLPYFKEGSYHDVAKIDEETYCPKTPYLRQQSFETLHWYELVHCHHQWK